LSGVASNGGAAGLWWLTISVSEVNATGFDVELAAANGSAITLGTAERLTTSA
jgi:hypothetical protein